MDDVCPITATRYSVKDLHLAITKPWRPWYTPQSEVIIHLYAVNPTILVLLSNCIMNWIMTQSRLEATLSNMREDSRLLQ
jgi:hypothetical protein